MQAKNESMKGNAIVNGEDIAERAISLIIVIKMMKMNLQKRSTCFILITKIMWP